MSTLNYKQFARRHRPHIHQPGSVLFLTYRLAGSIPRPTLRFYKAKKEWLQKEIKQLRNASLSRQLNLQARCRELEAFSRDWFLKFEEILHRANDGPMWMQDERIAEAVADSLHALDGTAYRLDVYSVMSNHVHTVFKPFLSEENLREMKDREGRRLFTSSYPSLSRIMHSVKGSSARECNLILSRSGSFWEHESFDHVIRPGKFGTTLRYVLNNPVKAGLVKRWQEWPWNYCRKELYDKF